MIASSEPESREPRDAPDLVDLLCSGDLEIRGRIMPASNHTYLCRVGGDEGVDAVYKPVSGERPLWDFPEGTLAHREYAAWLVSESLGWRIVPPTVLREGTAGVGMVQAWCEIDPETAPVALVPPGEPRTGVRHVLDAEDELGRPVSLIHEDSPALRRMALFDLVVNNTDRKGGHVLPMPGGHRHGVDHGVCFHVDDKVRTVLWGWAGEPLHADEAAALETLLDGFGALADDLAHHLAVDEVAATRRRLERLVRAGRFPRPGPGWPPIPWPAF